MFLNKIFSFILSFFRKKEAEFEAERFGYYLSTIRKSARLSLREVEKQGRAKGFNFSYNYVHKLEHAKFQKPDRKMVIEVLKTLGLGSQDIEATLKKYRI